MKNAIFHNPRCSKSRQTLELLEQRSVAVPVVEYLKDPPDAATLKSVCTLLGTRPYDLVRRKEALFAELKLASIKPDDDARWLKVLAAHPALLERPIVVYKGKAALGRPPENVLKILSTNWRVRDRPQRTQPRSCEAARSSASRLSSVKPA